MRPEEVSVFPVGEKNVAFGQYFVGQSYLNMLTTQGVAIGNVTFEPGCRNNWHIHHAKSGGGQILLCTAGRGYYQEWGQAPRELHPGDVVVIPPEVKHWHGAAPDSWFAHLAVEVPGEEPSNQWREAVREEEYRNLKGEPGPGGVPHRRGQMLPGGRRWSGGRAPPAARTGEIPRRLLQSQAQSDIILRNFRRLCRPLQVRRRNRGKCDCFEVRFRIH